MDKLLKSPWDKDDDNIWNTFLDYKSEKLNVSQNKELDVNNFVNTVESVYEKIISETIINILVFGYIQSGKTDFIIGIICKLFNNNHGVLVFAINQNNKDLLKQTIKRTSNIYNKNIYEYDHLKKKNQEIIEKISLGENVVVFLLKHSKHLSEAVNICKSLNSNHTEYKCVLIDDEADAASLNNIEKEEPSTIFRLINEIKENGNSNYISITATPFAHFLLPHDDKLKPKYAYMLHPGTGYTGIQYFIDRYQIENKSNFVEINRVNQTEIDELKINAGFKQALKTYIVQCYWWTYIKQFDNKPRMLINMYKKTDIHEKIEESVYYVLNDIKECYTRNKKLFDDIFVDLDISLEYKQDFEDKFDLIFSKIYPYQLNGKNKDRIDLDKSENELYRIVIGHTLLDRGLTIVDLINTYLSARSLLHPNADVILQQARFLGYREKYKESIRLFMTKDLIEDYVNINFDIEYFKSAIMNLDKFEKIKRFIPLEIINDLNPTRDTAALYEFVNGTGKKDLMNNKFYNDIYNELDEFNEKIYDTISKCKSSTLDSKEHKIVKLNGWSEFCDFIDIQRGKSETKNYLAKCCADPNNTLDVDIISKLIERNDIKIIVRLLGENIRKLNINKNMPYHSIGKGTYSSNETEYLFDENTLCIDVIPINVHSEEESINRLIYRTRIFIPSFLNQLSGFYAK